METALAPDGQAIKLPAYFSLHDDYESFDLKKNQWVTDDEKWSYPYINGGAFIHIVPHMSKDL
ncbi:hypothetical protein Q8G35_17715 [Peribacillus simplex]|uniref:Uncharacterized protein n=2 Tax=Peribacillus TaxID=2675229 RepID=A0AA90PH42_9BACI|nr:hypothetical protein [Peribacillus simplex]MDP1420178.1 hypothetical protein [Peribacillus simplex]MDP1454356.1 hypothetical protein [Peribacillus frigoritolerans]